MDEGMCSTAFPACHLAYPRCMEDEVRRNPELRTLLNSILVWQSRRCDRLIQGGHLADALALAQEFSGWRDGEADGTVRSDRR